MRNVAAKHTRFGMCMGVVSFAKGCSVGVARLATADGGN